MKRKDGEEKACAAAYACLEEKGYIAMVDVFLRMGKLTHEKHEDWRFRRVPHLEQVILGNLNQINAMMRAVRSKALNEWGLKPSLTTYTYWGKNRGIPARFSKYGDPGVERAYATHYVRSGGTPQKRIRSEAPRKESSRPSLQSSGESKSIEKTS